jgi:uncharacterized membrane protein YfcA
MSEFISSIGRSAGGFFNFGKPNDLRAGSIVTCAAIGAIYYLTSSLESRKTEPKPSIHDFPNAFKNTVTIFTGMAAGGLVGAFAPITFPVIAITILNQAGIKGTMSKTP